VSVGLVTSTVVPAVYDFTARDSTCPFVIVNPAKNAAMIATMRPKASSHL
jgi:hypothetical protein